MAKQLPIRRVGTKVPPVFEWNQHIVAPNGASRTILQQGSVAVSMEKALCDLIAEAERLRAENVALKNKVLPPAPSLLPQPVQVANPAQIAPVTKKKGK